jgi:PPP family 3-phenylpropionic acid transporter
MNRLAARGTNRPVTLFFLIYLTFWLADACLSPYLGVVYVNKGLSGAQIGFVEMVMYIVMPFTSIIIGAICDRFQNSRVVAVALNIGIISATAMLSFSQGYFSIMLCVFAYGFCFAPVNDIVDKMLFDQMGDNSPRYSRVRMGGTVGSAIGACIAGNIMLRAGIPALFVAFWVIMLCCACICVFIPKRKMEFGRVRAKDWLEILKSKSFLSIYVTLMVFGFTEAGSAHLRSLHIIAQGYEPHYVSIFAFVQLFGEGLTFWLAPKAIKRWNINFIVCVAFLLEAVKSASLQILGIYPVQLTFIGQVLGGGAFALMYPTMAYTISRTFKSSVSNTAQTMKTMSIQGVGMTLGVLFFGRMYDAGNTTMGYMVTTLLALACTLFFFVKYCLSRKRDR